MDVAEGLLEKGQQPHKDHLAEIPMEHVFNVDSRATLLGIAP